jgi:protease I
LAIIFIGGPGMIDLINNSIFVDLAKEFYNANKIVAGICVGVGVLANAGILKGISSTSWSGITQLLLRKGAIVVAKPVVWSDKIITAEGPQAVQEFEEIRELCE